MSQLSESIALLQQFEQFKQQHPDGDFSDFGVWLQRQAKPNGQKMAAFRSAMPFPMPAAGPSEYIGWIWGRLLKFTAIWEKKAFDGMPLQNLEEFGLMMYIQQHAPLNRTRVAEASLMEKTTCFEMLKRLLHRGMLSEKLDEEDKRNKLLSLTPQGQAALFQSFARVKEVSHWLTKRLNEEEKEDLLAMLIKLEQFHDRQWTERGHHSWTELVEN
jgi:DNA-binding MarR family transcriptional regulator